MSIRRAIALFSVLLLLALGALWATYKWSEDYFLSEIADRGRTSLDLYAENIRGWLGRYRSLPQIYARNPTIAALLRTPDDAVLLERVNDSLSDWNLSTGAADTYLLDKDGTCIAASNWDDEVTFIGKNYSYRPYYTHAVQGSLGRFFALGTASHKRGYYFGYPVHDGSEIIGVTVVKVGVSEIEAKLQASPDELFVTGPDGVILLAGPMDWRLKALAPLDEAARQRIVENRQFDLNDLETVGPFGSAVKQGDGQLVMAGPDPEAGLEEFLHLSVPMTIEGWRLHILVNTGFARGQIVTSTLLASSLLLGVGLIATVIWQRRRRLVERLGERERARATLEHTVKERTSDLQASNLKLEAEVAERKAAETELRQTQSELVQAGKLAALGQMSAALSHEFNQPLSAIRTYADNAGVFLDRGREEEAQSNIAHIVALTDRMAGLSKHLSSFARRPEGSVRPILLNEALDETLTLLSGRLRAAAVTPDVTMPEEPIWVMGGHIRLQQVIMNLVTNALDAMKGIDDPELIVILERVGDRVRLSVEDNGHGLSDELREKIFDPFFTTKEVGAGLGLGLSISYNIVKDFGGSIAAENREARGARFTLTLRPAEPPAESDESQKAAE